MTVAVLVNLHARRGSEGIGERIRSLLPLARIAVTRSMADVRRWIADELLPQPPTLLLSGGGDGTAVALLNELRTSGAPIPALGVLPLGTGNGWAHETGAPSAMEAICRIAALRGAPPPLRRFALVETEGQVAPFAGTGFDAELVSDFHAQLEEKPAAIREASAGLGGYLSALFSRTLPRAVWNGQSRVRVVNLGEDALTVDDEGRIVPIPGGTRGALLYDGPVGVAGAASTPEWGFGFRAYPFAEAVPGRISTRVYGAGPIEAASRMFQLWRGAHPLPKMHDFFVTRLRMDFDRDVPFQIGGDPIGPRRSIELAIADQHVDLVDWRKMGTRGAMVN